MSSSNSLLASFWTVASWLSVSTAAYMPNVMLILPHILRCQQWTCESKSCSCYYGSITVVTIQDASSDSVLVTQRVPANRYNLMWRYVYTDFHILHFTLCHIRSYNSRHDATKLSECVSLFTVVSVSVCVVSVYLRREKLTVRLSVTTVFFQRYFVQTMLHVSALS